MEPLGWISRLDRPVVVCVFPVCAAAGTPSKEIACESFQKMAVSITESPSLTRPYYDNGGNPLIVSQYTITTLADQKINTIDTGYYDCIYRTTNPALNVTQLCYKDIGCCATDCCKDTDWSTKYGWAVALIVIFCILVILAVVITLIIWLINRAKDKKQKRQLLHGSGISPATSQMSLARPIQGGYHFGTGPYQNPPDGGYRY